MASTRAGPGDRCGDPDHLVDNLAAATSRLNADELA